MCLYILCFSIYTVTQNSFSCGYSFFYWPYYQHKDYIFGSHKGSELFIGSGKYKSLKEEILSNQDNEISDIKMWNDDVILLCFLLSYAERRLFAHTQLFCTHIFRFHI